MIGGLDEEHALFANAAFYQAFADRDAAAMDALWARSHPVTCLHPGWNPLTDREDIVDSWRAILDNADAPKVTSRGARAFVSAGTVLVLCYERIGDAVLVASNLFAMEDGAARIVHHQAGPCAHPPVGDDRPETLQ